ncbi:MAG: phosphate acetyltransferase [Candidatus Nanopelagicales bacterium]|nr:phosphate acetyltransferase [Candidatus Nanopelagicales bacterium]
MRALYLTSVEASSGKSVAALGLMETLTRSVSRVGYFRPVIRAGAADKRIELFRTRYRLEQSYDESFGVTGDETRDFGGNHVDPALVSRIIERFRRLANRCDYVLVEGTDYLGASKAFEFALNAEIASNLGAVALIVLTAADHAPAQVNGALTAAVEGLGERGVPTVGAFVNRVPQADWSAMGKAVAGCAVPVWMLPELDSLTHPTIREVAGAVRAMLLLGSDDDLSRPVSDIKVAAMSVPRLMDHLSEGTLLITPGDRSDIIMAAYSSRQSDAIPAVSGVVLTGGLDPDPTVMRFAAGITQAASLPILITNLDTYDTAAAVSGLHGEISADDTRKITDALSLFEEHVDEAELESRIDVTRSTTMTPMMFEHQLVERARSDRKHIVLPEGDDDRILEAADRLLRRNVVDLTILGRRDALTERARQLGLDIAAARIIDPETDMLREAFAADLVELRRAKGLALDAARDQVADVSYFGTMMVWKGLADGMVSGAAHTTAHTVRPALQIIKTSPGVSIVSSVFFMALEDRVLVYGDCAINPDPDATQLADIAISSAETARAFGVEPRVAMLSYSTGSSGSGEGVEKVRAATEIARERRPDLAIEGPIQYDAAVDASVAKSKLPGSEVAGRATVFIFPDLNTGNNTYKAVQRSANAIAIGPVLQGLRLPVNDLSRGALVEDIINTVVITAVQAQQVAAATKEAGR